MRLSEKQQFKELELCIKEQKSLEWYKEDFLKKMNIWLKKRNYELNWKQQLRYTLAMGAMDMTLENFAVECYYEYINPESEDL